MNRTRFQMTIIGTILLTAVGVAQAAPPPLGPPAPSDPIKELAINAILTSSVKYQINQAIGKVNIAAAANPDVHATVNVSQFNVHGPSLFFTQYPDRPNERYVDVPYIVEYLVHDIQKHTSLGWIGVGVERHISQSIDLQMFCNKWQTGHGTLKLVVKIDPPYLEDEQGTLEQVVNFFVANTLTSYIDSRMREQLGQLPAGTFSQTLPGQWDCNTIGAYAGQPSDLTDDVIQYSYHPPRVVSTAGLTPFDQVSVKLLSLKRLTAHDMNGAVLYKPVETPALEFYANYQHAYVSLPSLQEGQQLTLSVPTLTLTRPGDSDSLVLISNIIQNPPTDTLWRAFGRDTNFGNGIQTIRIQKSYWVPFNPRTGAKPYQLYVDAYELTFQVNASLPTMSPGMSTAPGGVAPGGLVPGMTAPIMRRGIEGEQPSEAAPGISGPPEQTVPEQSSGKKSE